MSLPSYLARIKSSGVYRFVWDKSQLPPQTAETLRMVVGYSEKGPFNTPVYIDNVADFKTIYGNGSKRLEKRGVFFHRLAQQALSSGPILALNLKPFGEEKVKCLKFDNSVESAEDVLLTSIYDQERFWKLDEDKLPELLGVNKNYFNIVATDTKEKSCSIFIRKTNKKNLKQYKDITLREWYNNQSLEYPEYLENKLDTNIDDYFVDIYVFRGEFTSNICGGVLKGYFDVDGETVTLKKTITNSFGQEIDVLEALASNSNSNFIQSYRGCTLPQFKDANDNYISIDIKLNADYNNHQLLMKLNDDIFDETPDFSPILTDVESLSPIYLEGYTYETITKKSSAKDIYRGSMEVLTNYKGIYTALTNRVDVEYHYLVDTFGTNCSRKEFFELAKAKDNTFAIVNFPAASEIKPAGTTWDTAISEAAMPGESEGASWGAYYTQLIFSDGTVKTTVPSAALVSNLFMEKWGPRKPYYIVAGPTYGQISYSGLVGPDYNYGREDLDELEPAGVNVIIYVPRLGIYINSNQTAKQRPVSALSKVHIRELVIYLQNEIENLLQSYQWELNTQSLRSVIKSKADVICENIQQNGGLYAFVNICDESNNTPEVIDNEMIILDTEIEPARGAGKMVHQLTIHRTGGLSSSVK